MRTNKLLNTAPEESRTNVVGRKRKQFSELPPPNKHIKLDDDSDQGSSSEEDDDEVDNRSRAHSSSNSRESGEVSSDDSPDPSRLAKEAWQSDADSPRKNYSDSDSDARDERGVTDDEGVVDLTGDSPAAQKPESSSRLQQRASNGTQEKAPVKFTPKPAPQRNQYDELLCPRCSKTGHNSDGCPMLWKSFFPVASSVKKIPKADMIVSCYNCGVCNMRDGDRAAHWGDECPYLPAFLKDNPSGLWGRKWAELFVLGWDENDAGATGGNGAWQGQRAAFYDGRD